MCDVEFGYAILASCIVICVTIISFKILDKTNKIVKPEITELAKDQTTNENLAESLKTMLKIFTQDENILTIPDQIMDAKDEDLDNMEFLMNAFLKNKK